MLREFISGFLLYSYIELASYKTLDATLILV
jgi:hypothetical protein